MINQIKNDDNFHKNKFFPNNLYYKQLFLEIALNTNFK